MQRFSNLCALVLLGLIFLVSNARGTDMDMSISFLSPTTPTIQVKPETGANTFLQSTSSSPIKSCSLSAGPLVSTTNTSITKGGVLQDLQLFMRAGSVTNKLFLACITGGLYGKANVYFRTSTENAQTVFLIEMKEVKVKSVEMSEDDGVLFARVTLSPAGATLTAYTAQPNGIMVAGDPVTLSNP